MTKKQISQISQALEGLEGLVPENDQVDSPAVDFARRVAASIGMRPSEIPPSLRMDEAGKPMPLVDSDGNPIVDSDGNLAGFQEITFEEERNAVLQARQEFLTLLFAAEEDRAAKAGELLASDIGQPSAAEIEIAQRLRQIANRIAPEVDTELRAVALGAFLVKGLFDGANGQNVLTGVTLPFETAFGEEGKTLAAMAAARRKKS